MIDGPLAEAVTGRPSSTSHLQRFRVSRGPCRPIPGKPSAVHGTGSAGTELGARNPDRAPQKLGIRGARGRAVSAVQKVFRSNNIGVEGGGRARKILASVDDLFLVADCETLRTDRPRPALDRRQGDVSFYLFRGYFRRSAPSVDAAGTAAAATSSRAFRA
jgi:hypothetical protein